MSGLSEPLAARGASTDERWSSGTLLEVDDLRTGFRTERGLVRAVDGVSLTLERGRVARHRRRERLRQDRVDPIDHGADARQRGAVRSGAVRYEGVDITTFTPKQMRGIWGREMAMVFQDPMSSLNPLMRVGEQVAEPLRVHLDMPGQAGDARPPSASSATSASPKPHRRLASTRTNCRVACANG